MARMENRKLERVQYWQGQMLRSQDFLNLQRVEAQRRWWHNRALHNAYGVAEGLACSLVPAGAPTGVSVGVGVAYDLFGRELILERPLIIPLPVNIRHGMIGAVSLLMRYNSSSRPMNSEEISEVCWNAPGSVTAGTAEFVWAIGDRLDPAMGVAVHAIYFSATGLLGADPSFNRISTQALASPLLASGATIPGGTPWEPWSIGFLPDGAGSPFPNVIGVQTWIDTSAAGFTRVPCYFASLQGPLWSAKTRQLVPAIFPSITAEGITGFTFRLWLQIVAPVTYVLEARQVVQDSFSYVTWPSDFLLYAQQQDLFVEWIGCQMPASISSCSIPAPSASLGAASLVSALPLNSR
jgi:hypothetical protein